VVEVSARCDHKGPVMPRVCVVEVSAYCDQCAAQSLCSERSGTDWEEVTEEELKALDAYAVAYNRDAYRTNRYLLVVREVLRPTWEKGVKNFLAKAKKQMEAEENKNQRKAAAEEERKKKLAKKQEEKERKKFEELRAKFG
jgi:hypothetical protein